MTLPKKPRKGKYYNPKKILTTKSVLEKNVDKKKILPKKLQKQF